jgi:hypothetical protein
MSFVHSPKIVTDGLVLSLDAGNVKSYPGSGTVWTDKSGFNNNGTLTNGPTFNSANGGSIVFDGVDDYFQAFNNYSSLEMQPTVPYSCFVMFQTAINNTKGVLVSNMDVNTNSSGWDCFLDASTNIAGMHLINSWTSNAIKVQVGLSKEQYLNNWMYFGFTYDGTSPTTISDSINSVSFYVNGLLYNNGKTNETADGFDNSSTAITYSQNQKFRIASRFSSSKNYGIAGNFGIIHLYKNKILSPQEVLQNYNATKSRFNIT